MKAWLMDKMDAEVYKNKIRTEETPLHKALHDKNEKLALELIPKTENVDMPDPDYLITPMHLAVRAEFITVIKALIEAGANADSRDDAGQSPLHGAAYHGNVDIIQILLDRNVSINIQAFGCGMYSPLMTAVRNDHIEATELLLKVGGDRYAQDKRDKSCISYSETKPWLQDLLKKIPRTNPIKKENIKYYPKIAQN